uniref:WSN domain-containing protein n=1 Tax=Caenorhabditis tropicalis TaxID=1561998 RepID=A0A1I7UFD9_9PELO
MKMYSTLWRCFSLRILTESVNLERKRVKGDDDSCSVGGKREHLAVLLSFKTLIVNTFYTFYKLSTKELSTIRSELENVAHLTSSIYVEVGLMNKSVPSDTFIICAIRMGDAKPDDLIVIKADTIKKAFEELGKLKGNTGDPDGEKLVIALDGMRKDAAVYKNLAEKKVLDLYKTSLEDVKGLEEYKDLLTEVHNAVKAFIQSLKTFRSTKLTLKNLYRIGDDMRTVYNNLQVIEESVESFKDVTKQIKKAKKIDAKPKFIIDFLNEEKLRSDVQSATKADIQALIGIIQTLLADTKETAISAPGLQTIKKLAEARDPINRHKYTYAPGLPKDVSDLDQSSVDKKLIIGDLTNSSLVSNSISKALLHLIPLGSKLKKIDSALKPIEDESKRRALLEIINFLLRIASAKSEGIEAAFNELDGCKGKAGSPTSAFDELKKIEEAMDKLHNDLNNLHDFSDMAQFKDLSKMKNDFLIEETDATKKKEMVEKTLGKLKADEFKDIEEKLAILGNQTASFFSFINQPPLDLSNLEKHQETLKKVSGIYTCLEEIKTQGAGELVEIIKEARNITVPQEMTTLTFGIVDQGSVMSQVKIEAGDFDKIKNEEVIALKIAFEALDVELIEVIRGTLEVIRFIEQSDHWKVLIDFKIDDPEWGQFSNALKTYLQSTDSLQKLLEDLVKNLQKGEEIKLEAAIQIIQEAEKAKEVKMDEEAARNLIEKLYKSNPTEYKDAWEAFQKLQQLNLSGFPSGKAEIGFASLHASMKKYAAALSSKSSSGDPDSGATPSATETESTKKEESSGLLGPFLGGGVAFCVISGGVLFWYCRRPKPVPDGKKEDDDSGSQAGDDHPSAVPPPPPPPLANDQNPNPANNQNLPPANDQHPVVAPENPPPRVEPPAQNNADADHHQVASRSSSGVSTANPGEQVEQEVDEPENNENNENVQEEAPPPNNPLRFIESYANIMTNLRHHAESGLTAYGHSAKLCETEKIKHEQQTTPDERENMTERRYAGVVCKAATQTALPPSYANDKYFNCNSITFEGDEILMSQGPQDDTEFMNGRNGGTRLRDTREKHWAAIEFHKIILSIMLCNFIEKDDEGKMRKKCGYYFPMKEKEVMKIGKYEIECIEVLENVLGFKDPKNCKLYRLKYTNTETKETNFTAILHYTGWPDHGVPETPEQCLEIAEYIRAHKGNKLVHCSAGVGRTGTVVGVLIGMKNFEEVPNYGPSSLLQDLRERRYYAIQTGDQLLFCLYCCLKGLTLKHKIENSKELRTLQYMCSNMGKYEEWEKKSEDEKIQLLKEHYRVFDEMEAEREI